MVDIISLHLQEFELISILIYYMLNCICIYLTPKYLLNNLCVQHKITRCTLHTCTCTCYTYGGPLDVYHANSSRTKKHMSCEQK